MTETPARSRRGSTSKDVQGSAEDVRRRKIWLVETYRANVDLLVIVDRGDCLGPFDLPTIVEHAATPTNIAEAELALMLAGPDLFAFEVVPAARCYRCGDLTRAACTVAGVELRSTITPDRITPGCVKTAEYPKGGTYVRKNLRPACLSCNTSTGGALGAARRNRRK